MWRDVCIEFKFDGAQDFARMCMCIEFLIQVLKHKNAHEFFLLGWQARSCGGKTKKWEKASTPVSSWISAFHEFG